MANASVIRLRSPTSTPPPRQNGEKARLRVLKGPDQGTVFALTADRASIGRGEEGDVVLTDLRASRLHAEIARAALGWSARDLGSATESCTTASARGRLRSKAETR
jgi:pSer/pThr/pTyr-binding forkhead associated (FHA) protein